jgi:hypothetical protein
MSNVILIELEAICSECGKIVSVHKDGDIVAIDPCDKCMDAEYERGIDVGESRNM